LLSKYNIKELNVKKEEMNIRLKNLYKLLDKHINLIKNSNDNETLYHSAYWIKRTIDEILYLKDTTYVIDEETFLSDKELPF